MRKMVVNIPLNELPAARFDVVIAGGGLSGIYAALMTDRRLSVALLCKTTLTQSNSMLAQGGVAAAIGVGDSAEDHFRDTMTASADFSNTEALKELVKGGPAEISRLTLLGVPFETDPAGNYKTGREGAHSQPRILRCGGDATGKIIMQTLLEQAYKRPNIKIFENHYLTDIVSDSIGQVAGAVAFNSGFRLFAAPCVLLATGGVGGLYKVSTNETIMLGDGIAAACRAEVRLEDLEFVQFHPTAFSIPNTNGTSFLISETVRGEGAVLRSIHGDAFMQGKHILKDLAPRDIVAREIFCEMTETGQNHVFLDITSKSAVFLKQRFPVIYKHCTDHGIFMEKDMIPVNPAQHYIMGGIKTDLFGLTSMPGLYACGETASTGVHGANRLAGNSLLECVVFAFRTSQFINEQNFGEPKFKPMLVQTFSETLPQQTIDLQAEKKRIRHLMHGYGGIVKTPEGLIHALSLINEILEKVSADNLNRPDAIELFNMAIVSRQILLSALARPDNLGAHWFGTLSVADQPINW